MHGAHRALSLLARCPLPEHPAHQPRHRLHGRLHRALHLRRRRCPPADVAAGVRPRSFPALQHHLLEPGPHGAEEPGARSQRTLRRFAPAQAEHSSRVDCRKPLPYAKQTQALAQPPSAARHPPGLWRRTAGHVRGRCFHRARHPAVLLRPRHPGGERLWPHRGRHRHHPQRLQALPA